jgi:alanyl-tRNA synthetase
LFEEVLNMKKYWDDPYVMSFESKIVNVLDRQGQLGLILEETCFFPEGGGQPSDRGLIASRRVIDVQESGSQVVHFLKRDEMSDTELGKGMVVSCEIDKEYRMHNMRIHSACHLLFGAARKMFPRVNYAGFNISKLGNLYLETEQPITAERLREIQALANECVVENRPITAYWIDSQDANSLDGLAYSTELPGEQIRIIEIEDWDVAACSGTHVLRTVEVGPIKVVAREIHKKHVTRLDYAVGKAAVAAITDDERILAETAASVGTSKDQLNQVVRKMASDLQDSRKSLRKLGGMLVDYKAEELSQHGETVGGVLLIIDTADYLDSALLRTMIARIVSERDSVVAALIGVEDKVTIVAGCSQDVVINLVEPIVRIAKKYGGGGGGRPGFANAGGINGSVGTVRDEVEMELKRILEDA